MKENNWFNMSDMFAEPFWKEFNDVWQAQIALCDVVATPDELLLYLAIPGLKNLNDIHVTVKGHQTLLVKGKGLQRDVYQKKGEGEVLSEEIPKGQFSKEISLPFSVDTNHVDATYHYGLLCLAFRRTRPGTNVSMNHPFPKAQQRRISIENTPPDE
ncbi:Hsp20/alpha crystallin family protein [Bacillaceae bacterium SIJ1]|uniref:Hsp20/alpha crystallin family protein n=1 Tax=Litoribacterium kuwaitense TaxID=1398745 RepID=UPI0013ECCE8F|nr:Hsp20/alpha crystallin family protein [Litoribacterium kuwaitense]NGP46062.1 Hsp20/alpha crystallin family protein [Litoribacterium kuwaitense]